jgi:hypothetical protein
MGMFVFPWPVSEEQWNKLSNLKSWLLTVTNKLKGIKGSSKKGTCLTSQRA